MRSRLGPICAMISAFSFLCALILEIAGHPRPIVIESAILFAVWELIETIKEQRP